MAKGRNENKDRTMKCLVLITNCLLLTIGTFGGALVIHIYFFHGGHRVWLSSFLETANFPLKNFPFLFLFLNFGLWGRACRPSSSLIHPHKMKPSSLSWSVVLNKSMTSLGRPRPHPRAVSKIGNAT